MVYFFFSKITLSLPSPHISTVSPALSCKYLATSTGKVIFKLLPTLLALTSNLMGISILPFTVYTKDIFKYKFIHNILQGINMNAHKVDPMSENGLKMTYYSQADCLTYVQNKFNWQCGKCGKVYLNRWQAQECCSVISCVQTDVNKKPQTALSPDLSQCTPGSANVAVCPDTKSTQVKGIRTNGQGDISENTSVHKENIEEVKE